jgi:NAD(P)-dependent dehydrogenase (short-subunit alcohol dehydrogenase family)
MRRLDGRIALITAAGSGMGRASAERFASEGAHVIVSDVNEPAAKEVTQAIVDAGGAATAVGCDVGDLDQIKSMIAGVERDHGVLHVLFNHAGIPGPAGLDIEPDQWAKAVDVNQRSAFFATKYALPLLRAADGKGSIIFTSSVSGEVGSPYSPLYSMTKGGIVLLMKSLAVRLGPEDIRSNAILLAMIETRCCRSSSAAKTVRTSKTSRRLTSLRCRWGGPPPPQRLRAWRPSWPATTRAG